MKRTVSRRIAGLLSLVMFFVLVVHTTGSGQVMKGLDEVNAAGGLFFATSSGNTSSAFQFNLTYGHFVTDKLELGAIIGINKFEDVDAFGTMNALLSFHFPTSSTDTQVPFLGARIGFDYGPGENPVLYGVFGGIKVFTEGGGGAYSIQLYYTGRNDEDDTFHRYGVENGISIFF